MIWVFGNSPERVVIKDLNDVIYFRQKKQYSDQEFESSKDLQREIQKSRIIKLEHIPEIKGSFPDTLGGNVPQQQSVTIDLAGIRRVVTEVVSENKSKDMDVQGLVTSLVPMITETIRMELSKVSVGVGQGPVKASTFTGPEYVPEVSSKGMKSNITVEGKQMEGAGVSDSLNALKKLNKST